MNNEPINMTATNDRRLAIIRADAARLATPAMPSIIRRPPPKNRRNSVPHRAIR
jgi:hypothetical protein